MIKKQKVKSLSLLLMILITSFFTFLQLNLFFMDTDKFDKDSEIITNPKTSIKGNASWWDKSYRSRQLINITNPYPVNFENYGVSISFNYTDLVNQGQMNSSLKDVRIIEYDSEGIPFIRRYYFKMNYPQQDIATVWFDTNISASTTEYDTYLYYGKETAQIDDEGHYFMNTATNSPSDSFGLIRNGNFELDVKTGTLIDGTFGWNFTDDVPEDIGPGYAPNVPGANYQHNLSNYVGQHEDVYEGDYSFKWGTTDHYLPSEGSSNEFIGTLFSYPFIVPKISGAGSPKLYIQTWRNVRLYDMSNPRWIEFYARTSKDYSQTMDTGHNGLPDGLAEDWISIGDSKGSEYIAENQLDLSQANTYIGELMDVIYLDVTNHQGELIFLEFGMWGIEGDKVSAFAQVDDVRFNYILTTVLNPEIEERRSDITIITRDVDGRLVPNAEVSLMNMSDSIETKFTSLDDASVTFTGIDFGEYNFTVNYTLPSGREEEMYNSFENGEGPFYIQQAIENETLYIDMWTIDFEMVDFDNEPLTMGNITIRDADDEFLTNLTLNDEGKATFRWRNQSKYYYKVWYDNDDYNLNPTALNASYILRDTYNQLNNKYRTVTVDINATNTASGPNFAVSELFYTDGSRTELGNKKIIKINVTITVPEPASTLSSVSIYYIDKNNSTDGNLIYYNDSYTLSDKINLIQIDIRNPLIMSGNLKSDKFEVYGLKIEVIGENSSRCDGIIKLDSIETCNIYNVTDLCKVDIKIIGTDYAGVAGCYVIVNSSNRDGLFNVSLLTKDLTGYAYGQINTNIPLWYLRGYNYTFSLEFFGEHQDLNVTESDKWKPSGPRYSYNYRLNQSADLIFQLYLSGGINTSWYLTRFENLMMVEQVMWSEDITVSVNFTLTTDEWQTSRAVDPPATVTCTIKSTGISAKVWLTLDMDPGVGPGIYTITFDSSVLSAGNTGKIYSIIVSGNKAGYSLPANVSTTILISTVPTVLSMHDYYNSLNVISEFSQTFGEFVNLTVKYYNDTNSPLENAILTYEWLNLDPILFYEDPINDGYYTATIDTSIAESWGLKSIKIIAKLENFTTQTLITSLSITQRPTTLNGETDLVYINSRVWVEDSHLFEFQYADVIENEIIGNLTTATFIWEKLYPNGTRVPGIHGTGTLIQNANKTYILDFNTELRPVGYYYLYLTLQKQNYEVKAALINLEIMLRNFTATLDATGLRDNNQIRVVQGDDINFEITLWDETRNIELENATITLTIGGNDYIVDMTASGVYELTFKTNDISAFITSRTFSGRITIQASNFTTKEIIITVIVQMEEIFPGMPTFYFILITVSIIGVVGSLVAYRVIQQARIPKHVKKIRKVKGYIKSKKKITETVAVPTKEEMIVKLFGNEWKEIGLSIEKVLGIEELKPEKQPLKEFKKGGESE
ncbi:MAG: hypothetical protein ACFFB0_16340 [Promethearchaeota archaeon]